MNQLIALGTLLYVRAVSFPSIHVDSDAIDNNNNEEETRSKTTIIAFKNVKGDKQKIVEDLDTYGFIVDTMYALPNGKYTVLAHISSKLLLMLTSVYANDLSNMKPADMIEPHYHMRISEKAILTLPTDFLQEISYQIVSLVPSNVAQAIASGNVSVTDNLHKYFGSKCAITLSWLRFSSQSLFPGFALWLMMILSNEWEYAPLVGTLSTVFFSFAIGYLRVSVKLDLHKHETIRDLSIKNSDLIKEMIGINGLNVQTERDATEEATESAKIRQINQQNTNKSNKRGGRGLALDGSVNPLMLLASVGFMFTLSILQVFLVYIFDYLNTSETTTNFNTYLCGIGEIVYYIISMSIVISLEHTILLWLTDWEALSTMQQRSTSNAVKQFIAKVGIFWWKVVFFIVNGKQLQSAQFPVTMLMAAHVFLYEYLVVFLRKIFNWSSSSYSVNKATHRRKLDFDINQMDQIIKYSVLDNRKLRQKSKLTEYDKKILIDCTKPSFACRTLYSESVITCAAMLLLARISPGSIALCMIQLWKLLTFALNHLIKDCQYPILTEEPSMEPWLTIMEVFSILAVAWNVGTLFFGGFGNQHILETATATAATATAVSEVVSEVVSSSSVASFATTVVQNISTVAASFSFVPTGSIEQHMNAVDGLFWQLFISINSIFSLPNTRPIMIIWCIAIEHLLMLIRCIIYPYILYVTIGFDLDAQQALFAIAENNEIISAILYRSNLLARNIFEKAISTEITENWKQKYRLAKTYTLDDSNSAPSMSPILYGALAMIPFCCSTLFNVSWKYTTIPLTIICAYYHTKIERQKRSVALSIISDPDVFDVIAQEEFKQFTYSNDMDRSNWCNKMFELTWSALKEFAYITIKKAADPELERAKPSFASFLRMTKLTMGNIPPHFLPGGIRVLEPSPGKDMIEMEVDIVWNSDMEMAISLGLGIGQEITLNMSKLRFSGTCRVQCLPLIPFVPPFAFAKVTFFKRPFIDFSLIFGDTELLDNTTSSSTITTVMTRILRNVLETMALYPKWINVPMVGRVERFIKHSPEYYLNTPPMGILTVRIVKCNNLIVGDITTSDPYVVLTIRDEEYTTEVMYKTLNPVWTDEECSFLIYDKKMENVHVEVWDKDLGSVGSFLGRTDVYLPNLEDGAHKKLVLQLQGVNSGTITLEIDYNEIAATSYSQGISGDTNGIIDLKTLFDTMKAEDCKELASLVDYTESDILSLATNNGNANVNYGAVSSSMSKGAENMSPVGIPKQASTSFSQINKQNQRSRTRSELLASLSSSRVAGVLTVSSIGFSEVKSVKSMLSGTQYFSPYITFTMGSIKKHTPQSSTKKSSATFTKPFTFVVNQTSDVIKIKLKYATTMSHITLYEWTSSVDEIIYHSRKDGYQSMKQSIYDGFKLAVGVIYFKLEFRATVAHMRYENESRGFNGVNNTVNAGSNNGNGHSNNNNSNNNNLMWQSSSKDEEADVARTTATTGGNKEGNYDPTDV